MYKKILSGISWVPLLLLLPYLVISCFLGTELALTTHSPDPQDCLPILLAFQIPSSFEEETIKAQAVIARTNLYRGLKDASLLWVLHELLQEWDHFNNKRFEMLWYRHGTVFENAVEATKDMVFTYQKELPMIPYHAVSSGITRDGKETLHDDAYEYLISVESGVDALSPDFQKNIYLPRQLLPSDLKIKACDSLGYVTLLQGDGKLLDSEAFCRGMLLPSTNFTITESKDTYLFCCKGSGHGLGFSQFGGNELAKEGYTYQEILRKYFPKLTLEYIER